MRSFKKILSSKQLDILESYYTFVSKMPKRHEKTTLGLLYEMDPILINKWFQAKRAREYRHKKNVLEVGEGEGEIIAEVPVIANV